MKFHSLRTHLQRTSLLGFLFNGFLVSSLLVGCGETGPGKSSEESDETQGSGGADDGKQEGDHSGGGGTTPLGGATGAGAEGTGASSTGSGGTLNAGGGPFVGKDLKEALERAEQMTGADLLAAYPSPPHAELAYDPATASGLDLIQSSALALTEDEQARLSKEGLVIAKDRMFPSFAYGYKAIYFEDLPVYVSADSILEALHRSFDSLLKKIEERALLDEVELMLHDMRARIPDLITDAQVARDTDLYLGVAQALLGKIVLDPDPSDPVVPVTDLDVAEIDSLVALAMAAQGHQSVTLFGSSRDIDFSQFRPRGHYEDTPALQAYFRAMMWLGRIDMRLIETQQDGSQTFHRRDFDTAVALRLLMDEETFARFLKVDQAIAAFVGERDSMSPVELDGLLSALSIQSEADAAALSDEDIEAEILSGEWGSQRIASRILVKGAGAGQDPLPQDRSFLIFGQRYTVDSHTFVNTTFDRVSGRYMPNPLDAAFAAIKNDAALELLEDDLQNDSYAAGLAKTRILVDAHEKEYWESSAYTRWLSALSALSPGTEQDYAGVTPTGAFQNRILNTQLGSWSQLRHDTILYTKQSYTTGGTCEFPDAYVDPYPEFYRRLAALVEQVSGVAQQFPDATIQLYNENKLADQARTWAELFVEVMSHLEEMARNQQTGTPHSQELLDFVNAGVNWTIGAGCGPVWYDNLTGWYLKLFLFQDEGIEYDPAVADVHTQPTDPGGTDVGRILHVGTGMPRLMVVTANTCNGPRAYAGLAFSYGELITEGWTRLTDSEWSEEIETDFPDVPWMSPLIGE